VGGRGRLPHLVLRKEVTVGSRGGKRPQKKRRKTGHVKEEHPQVKADFSEAPSRRKDLSKSQKSLRPRFRDRKRVGRGRAKTSEIGD